MPTKRPPKSLTPAIRSVETLIRVVRGQKVVLDSDLAKLYDVETFNLNKAVKRNLERFPEEFMFQLTREETRNLTFQSGISSWGGRRHPPYAFTEHGVVMLSSVLNSPRAVQTNILLVKASIRMREFIATNKDIAVRIEKLERSHERTASVIEVLVEDIDRVALEVKKMKALPEPKRKHPIGFRIPGDDD